MVKLILSLLIFSHAFAEDSKKYDFFIVIEQSPAHMREQTSIEITGGNIEIVQNSNFIENGYPIHLGIFQSEPTDATRKLQSLKGLAEKKQEAVGRFEHDLHVYINGVLLDPRMVYENKIISLYQAALKSAKWKKVEGQVVIDSKSPILDCKSLAKDGYCQTKLGIVRP